jgi:hypothetical protein
MSDELRLPDDLGALEARLAAQALPASGVNRDELMYRAGWAAAEAKLAEARPRAAAPSPHHPPRQVRSLAAWSLSSAALAASLAVAVTLAVQNSRFERFANERGASLPGRAQFAVQTTSPPKAATFSARDQHGVAADYLAVINHSDIRDLAAPLLALYPRPALASRLRSTGPAIASDASAPAAKTARELRQELLPTSRPSDAGSRRPLLWPWTIYSSGESI